MYKLQKRLSELTDEDKRYKWLPLEIDVDDPLCVRGVKNVVLPSPPDGMAWVEVTEAQDSEQRFILCEVLEDGR